MSAQSVLQKIDLWCQWDQTFGADANRLRQFFSTNPEKLQNIFLLMLTTRTSEPRPKWLRNWEQLRASVPPDIMRCLLIGLAQKREWYAGQATEADSTFLAGLEAQGAQSGYDEQHSRITIKTSLASRRDAMGSSMVQSGYERDDVWYECLPEKDNQVTYKIAYGACYALVEFPDLEVRALLARLILKYISAPIWTFTRLADDDAIARLYSATTHTKDKRILSRIWTALDRLASERGQRREDLEDQSVPDHGLNALHERTWHIAEYDIRCSLTQGSRVRCTISEPTGKIIRKMPEQVCQDYHTEWQEILAERKELSATLSTQKKRLEAAMVDKRCWSLERWQALFVSHPILRHLARRLVWEIRDEDGTHCRYAMLNNDGSWLGVNGEMLTIQSKSILCISHPVEMPPEVQSGWQRFIITHRIVQPFKQVFRETYIITPAEEETRSYSNRFISHRVSRQCLNALAQSRGWSDTYIGQGSGVHRRDFNVQKVRAYLWHQGNGVLRQIAFYPQEHTLLHYQPELALDQSCIALRDIDPIVFSETLRDIDQYVVVGSLGIDVEWQDEQNAISRQIKMRQELLCELLLPLELNDSVHIQDRFALVQGRLHSYRVDLSNGSIYIEPNNRYLCIVPIYKADKLYLPFGESDPKTSEIISKIFLLVQDDQITNPAIVRQLP